MRKARLINQWKEYVLFCPRHCLSTSGCYKFLFLCITFCPTYLYTGFTYWYKFRVWVIPRVKDRANDISRYFHVTFWITCFNRVMISVNALTAVGALRVLSDFTLSNARRFYSSMGNPLAVKGLSRKSAFFICQCGENSHLTVRLKEKLGLAWQEGKKVCKRPIFSPHRCTLSTPSLPGGRH